MRLRHHRDFFKTASRLRSSLGRFYFLRLEGGDVAKIAILLSKNKHGRATERNRLRRKLKAAFSEALKEDKVGKQNLMIALYPTPTLSNFNYQEVVEKFSQALREMYKKGRS